MNHFTDKSGFDAIRSQEAWTFRAEQPRAQHHPVGAYFTTYDENEPNPSKKIFVPVAKLAYRFSFSPPTALKPLPGGRGRLRKIFYSPVDYVVLKEHQLLVGETSRA